MNVNSNNNVQSENNQDIQDSDSIDFSAILKKYSRKWRWFLLSFAICISLAIIYTLVANPIYRVSAKILIKENTSGGASMDFLSGFKDLGFDFGINNLDNEIAILQTRTLALQVSDSLNLRISYIYKEGLLRDVDLYKNSPLFVKLVNYENKITSTYEIDKKDKNLLTIKNKELNFEVTAKYGEIIETPEGGLFIEQNLNVKEEKFPITVIISSQVPVPPIDVNVINKRASVLAITMLSDNPEKASEIINTLIYLYNEQVFQDKNISARSTIDFINNRLEVISGELGSAEKKVEDYKKSQNMTDIQADAQIYLTTNSEYEKKLSDTNLQLSILSSIKDYLADNNNKDNIVPSNLGIQDATLLELIKAFNEAQLEKSKMTKGMKSDNPILKNYDEETKLLRLKLLENVKNVEQATKIARNEIQKQENLFSSKLSNLSTQEREFRELYRQQNIKESLYLYLLQKKEETGLYLTAVVPNAKIIDKTYIPSVPIAPRKSLVFLVAIVFSIIIPIILIYIKDILNYKIKDKEDLAKLKVPYLGDIPYSSELLLAPDESGTAVSERFRTNCINLEFVLNGEKHKTILVTSSLSGEGKTHYTTNLAIALSNLGKKVLLISLDLHKQRSDHFKLVKNISRDNGISSYLIGSIETVDEIIHKSNNYKNLDVIDSGPIPPNPAVLLTNIKVKELFDYVRDKYDYIIVDTPPIGLLADTMLINKFSDLTIYMVRLNYTPKKLLQNIQELYATKKLTNMYMLLKGSESNNTYDDYYGNKYYNSYYNNSKTKKK